VSVYSTVLCSVCQKHDVNSPQSTVGECRLVSIAFRPSFKFVGIHPEVRLEPLILPEGGSRIFVRRKYLMIILMLKYFVK